MWRGRVELWSVTLVVACGAVLKPPEPDRRLNVHTMGVMFESDGGYRFAAIPDFQSKVVRLDVRYPVGSVDDPPGKEGLAHLVEHVLFEVEITRDGTKTSIGAELGRLALWSNAETHEDYTVYETLAAPDALPDLLALEVDRLAVGCGGLTPQIVAQAREVVLNELRERQGASGAAVQRVINEAAFPEGHPYRAVDSIESVEKLDMKDVCDFLAGPYRRGEASVIASGLVKGPTLQIAARREFGRLHKRLAASRSIPQVEARPGKVRVRGGVDETTFLVMWPLPPRASHEYRLLEMVWNEIPDRIGSMGFEFRWGHSPGSMILGGANAPMLCVYLTLDSAAKLDDAIDATEKSVHAAVRSLGEDRDSTDWRVVWQAWAESLLARWESLGSRNELMGEFLDTGQGFLVERIEELVKTSPQETRALGEKWLAPGRARYVVIEPNSQSAASGHRTYAGGAETHGARVDAASADRPLPAPESSLRIATTRYTLDNGLKVILWPHGTAPLVHGRLVIDSGSAHDPSGKEGLSYLVGATDVYPDSLVFEDRELSTRVDDLVRTLAWELRSPGYELSDHVKEYMRDRLKTKRATERRTYSRDMLLAVYGASHPYARAAMTEQSIGEIHRDLVMDWARTHVVPKNAVLIVSGDFDPELVKRHVAYNADQVASGSDSPDINATSVPHADWIAGIQSKPSPTVEIDIEFLGARGLDDSHAKRLVLEQVVSSRLNTLRSKQAVTYGFSASYSPRRAGGLWELSGEVDATRAAEAATELTSILAEMRRDPNSYRTEFVLARQKVLERFLVSTRDSGAIADRLVEMARFDLRDDFYDQVAQEVAQLTLREFHDFLVQELPISHQVFGAFGNAVPVNAAIAAAKTK